MSQEATLSFIDTSGGANRVPLKDVCYLEMVTDQKLRIVYVPQNRVQRQRELIAQQLHARLLHRIFTPKIVSRTTFEARNEIMRPGWHGALYAQIAKVKITTPQGDISLQDLPEVGLQQVHGLEGWTSYCDPNGMRWINMHRVKKIEANNTQPDPTKPGSVPSPGIIITFRNADEILLCRGDAQKIHWLRTARDKIRASTIIRGHDL